MAADLRRFTPLSRNIVELFGLVVELPDGSTIKAVHYPRVESDVDEYQATRRMEYPLVIPPGGMGTLAEGQTVRLASERYYVAATEPLDLGWTSAMLQRADTLDALLVVDGAYLVVDGELLEATV